ncbi:MAG: ATP-binding protein [Candidatus Obscuribacterales bacterium]|nr:ATP-binding protein [Candidatus Obscuribacterales bacterium]
MPETANVKADSDRLIQVFVNLLSNAVKYSPKKGNIDVCATVGDGIWEVEIKDQAGGVPEELRDQLFERFIPGKNTEVVKSSGLGLYICKSLIEAQIGTIGYRPIEGGSSFFVRIARNRQLINDWFADWTRHAAGKIEPLLWSKVVGQGSYNRGRCGAGSSAGQLVQHRGTSS